MSLWTEETEDRFRSLWTEGLTASQIASRFGTTRSAICAKARRLNLPMRVPSGNSRPRPARARETRQRQPDEEVSNGPPVDRRLPQERTMPRAPRPSPPPPLVEPVAAVKADGAKFTLMDLSDKVCRWPVGTPGDEDFHFCGNAVEGGSPYCRFHARLSYQPLQDRRRRP